MDLYNNTELGTPVHVRTADESLALEGPGSTTNTGAS